MDPEADGSLGLALAVIASSSAPLLLLDSDLRVIAASKSFCLAIDMGADTIRKQDIFTLGDGEWNVPQLRSLLSTTLSGIDVDAYELDVQSSGRGLRRLLLNAHTLHYIPQGSPKILLTMLDITDARATAQLNGELIREKDDLLRQKAILLQEVQHRVANSLQIIASVLMQSARRVQSEETRAELRAAHNRVMSVAAVQQQLSVSSVGDVLLRPYFTQLCTSLGASMIRDANQIKLVVDVDNSAVDPDVSISLGLVVTELVINALKHAFPHHRHGSIIVSYHGLSAGWILSVNDDGVGMGPGVQKAGLGTSIVEALSKQLGAKVVVERPAKGTHVSIQQVKSMPPVAAV